MEKIVMGKVIVGVVFGIFITILIVALSGSGLKRTHVKVYHLKNGRYCYKEHTSHGDEWFWLLNTSSQDFYTGSSISSVPRGYTWVSNSIGKGMSLPVPDLEELLDIEAHSPESITEQEVVETSEGMPAVDGDGNLVDPTSIAPEVDTVTDSGNDSSSDSSDSGSSDSGGGDSGGD